MGTVFEARMVRVGGHDDANADSHSGGDGWT